MSESRATPCALRMTASTLRGNAWEQITLPLLARNKAILSFGPTGPLLKRNQIVTIHDAAVKAVPEAYGPEFRAWYGLLLPTLVRRTARVMTVSQFSRMELVRWFGAHPESVRVAGEGWEHALRTRADPATLSRHGLTAKRYVLVVGSLSPHKNCAVVARAMALLTHADFDVVVAGSVDPAVFGKLDDGALAPLKRVGYVTDAELRALYEGAGAFVHPSRYEGFGLPPLEAMALGCPVICSNAASLPEVCGEAALYFAPHDAEKLAELMQRVMSDQELGAELIARGRRQLEQHSWRACAARYLEALEELSEAPAASRSRSSSAEAVVTSRAR